MNRDTPAIGVIGGSGLYQMEGVEKATEQRVETPFGDPSDTIIAGHMHGRRFIFCRGTDADIGCFRTS